MKIILLICFVAFTNSAWINQAQIPHQDPDFPSQFTNLRTNYTTNISNDEMRFINNAINNAQKLYNNTQANEIAKTVAQTLGTVTENPWAVLVYDRFTVDIGIALTPYQNKAAVLIRTGLYNFSYALMQWNSLRCQKFDKTFSINTTDHNEYYGVSTLPEEISIIRDTASSSAIYAGSDPIVAARYIKDKMTKLKLTNWNAIVSYPISTSGAYSCLAVQVWGVLVGFGDLKYSYIIFEPPSL